MTDGFCPFAAVRNIPPGVNDPAITPRLAILHVDAGNASSLFEFFRDRSGGIESHFFVKADGTIEQYRSIYWQADANLDANDFAVSIETQGFGAGTWNAAQLASIKRLLLWLHETADIPLTVCKTWDGSGVGYHTMFGAPGHWTPVAKTCPGPDRIAQFHEVLEPWMAEASTPPKPTLFPVHHRIATANLFARNRDQSGGLARMVARVTKPLGGRPDAIGVQEGRLVEVQGYQTLVDKSDGEASHEIPVLLRSRLKVASTEYHHAADGTATGALDHPRGIFVVKYRKRGRRCALVNTHMGVFGEDKASAGRLGPAAVEHMEHAQMVARIVHRLRENGYIVHVTADANSRGDWSGSLPFVLASIGMTVTRHGIDLIASDSKRVRASVDVAIVPKTVTGADAHDGVAIRTTERKRP